MTIVDFNDDGCIVFKNLDDVGDSYEPSSLEQRKHFHDDLNKARMECESAGVGWPGWYWRDCVDLVGSFVLYEGDLYKVMGKTLVGFYGDLIIYYPKSPRADENGFVHCMGKPIPKSYNPFLRYYCESDRNLRDLTSGNRYIQMSLFDF